MEERIVELLNEVLTLDRPAMAALVANRVPCNHAVAGHPAVQVTAQNDGYTLGLLGLLNGLCNGRLIAEFEDDPAHPDGFKRLAKFALVPASRPAEVEGPTESAWRKAPRKRG